MAGVKRKMGTRWWTRENRSSSGHLNIGGEAASSSWRELY
jgi:hypothetical protein